MKKAFVILMAAFLLLSTAGVVMAEPTAVTITNKTLSEATENTKNVLVNVTLDLGNDYTVTIPADFTIEKVSTGTALDDYEYRSVGSPTVSVSVTLLEANAIIYVNVSSENYENNWTLEDDGGHKLPYWLKGTTDKNKHITDGNDVGILKENGSTVLKVTGDEGREPVYLHAKLITPPTVTGTYKDQLTFSVQYVEPPTATP